VTDSTFGTNSKQQQLPKPCNNTPLSALAPAADFPSALKLEADLASEAGPEEEYHVPEDNGAGAAAAADARGPPHAVCKRSKVDCPPPPALFVSAPLSAPTLPPPGSPPIPAPPSPASIPQASPNSLRSSASRCQQL